MADGRIVITRPLAGDAGAMLSAEGFRDTWTYPQNRTIPRGVLLEAIVGAAGIITTPADVVVDAEFFDAAGDQLRIVSNYAVGVDNIDLEEARRRDVLIGHTPGAVTEPTADIAWLLILGAARRVPEAGKLLHSGEWKGIAPQLLLGRRLVGKTLLIVGAGRIGHAVARRALGWDLEILYHARTRHDEFESPPVNARRVTLDEGLAAADIVSVHTPLTEDTFHLFDRDRFARMKQGSIFINTARGPVVDEEALAEALRQGRPGAAGLDVYEQEPHVHPGLRDLDAAFLLPHIGSATEEDRLWMTDIAVSNTICVLRDEPAPHIVQYPVD